LIDHEQLVINLGNRSNVEGSIRKRFQCKCHKVKRVVKNNPELLANAECLITFSKRCSTTDVKKTTDMIYCSTRKAIIRNESERDASVCEQQ